MKNPYGSALSRSSISKLLSSLFIVVIASLIIGSGNFAWADEGTVFSIHLFSFKTVEEAKTKAEEFSELGYNAFYMQEKEGKSEAYNVYIERFKSRSDAEKEANILKELDLISSFEIREIMERQKATSQNKKQETGIINKDVKDYYLKISSMRQKENAEELVKSLQDAGYHAFYNYETVEKTGEWYRVYIDEYKSKEAAESDAKRLIQSGIISSYEIKRATKDILSAEKAQKDKKKAYSLHIASFRSESNAADYIIGLSGSGIRAFSKKTEISGETWFRVYAGEFTDEEGAEKVGAELLEKGIISYFKPMIIDKSGD